MSSYIDSILKDPRITRADLKTIYEIDRSKAPDIYDAIKQGEYFMTEGCLFILKDGNNVETVIGNPKPLQAFGSCVVLEGSIGGE